MDLIKGKKLAVIVILAVAGFIAGIFLLGGPEQESEEVISKRVRLEVADEPPAGEPSPGAPAEPVLEAQSPEKESEPSVKPDDASEMTKSPRAPGVAVAPEEKMPKTVATRQAKPQESVKGRPSEMKAEAQSPSERAKPLEKKAVKTAAKDDTEAADPVKARQNAEKPVEKEVRKTAKTVKKISAKEIAKKPWAIGLASFKTLGEAQSVTSSLKAEHYNAYITETFKDGRKWYRVRIGFYAEKDEADAIGRRLSVKYGFKDIWVTRPSKNEAREHFK